MSDEVRAEIGRLLADRVEDLPDEITREFCCGCFPEDMRIHEGVIWAYRRDISFHSPFEQHPPEGEIAARHFIGGLGEGGAC